MLPGSPRQSCLCQDPAVEQPPHLSIILPVSLKVGEGRERGQFLQGTLRPSISGLFKKVFHASVGFPGGSVVKNHPVSAGDSGLTPGWRKSLGGGNSNPLQYSCLKNTMDREGWWTAAYQAPPSMGFSRQEYWSGVPLPSPQGSIYTYSVSS